MDNGHGTPDERRRAKPEGPLGWGTRGQEATPGPQDFPVIGTPGAPGPYPQQYPEPAAPISQHINHYHYVTDASTKSVGLAIVLAFFFGPLGMLYSTVTGALVMLVVNLVVALLTFGLGLVLTWPICVVWAAVSASTHNDRIAAVHARFYGWR